MSKKVLRAILLSLVIVLISLGGSTSASRAQSTAPGLPAKPAPDRGPFPQIPLAAPTIKTPSANLPLSPSTGEGWYKVVYQSYHNNNWEIYYGCGNGYFLSNLSNSTAEDARPKLSRDDRRVVFNSDRNSNIDIYAVNTDGTGLVRLTTNKFQDYDPAWSPDGTRIAFVSNRGPKSTSPVEVYVMNADGSDQTRLTYNGSGNISPNWSPDGKQIAWVIYSGIYGAIYVMNADGSNPHALTPILPYLQHPVWSPSGTRIAFDYDADGDGWNELVFMNSDGSGVHMVYKPTGTIQDAWMGSWLALEDKIAYTLVQYILYQGTYYIDYAHVNQLLVDEQTTNPIAWGDTNMEPDWLALDIYPPVSQVNPLPVFSRAAGFDISWSGVDIGISGLGMFYSQYRVGALGTWQDLNPFRTSNTTAHFSEQPGNKLYFRVAADDYAENMEAWPPGDGDTSTTLFTNKLDGMVRDQRGYPAAHSNVNIQPAPWETNLLSGPDGKFSTHLLNIGQTTFSAGHAGYAASNPINQNITADVSTQLYLKPAEDLVQNGSFESGLSSWAISGSLTATIGAPYSENNAAMLGKACDTPCLSDAERPFPAVMNDYPTTALDKDGNLHVIWSSLKYSVRDIHGSWSPVVTLSGHGSTGKEEDIKSDIAVDAAGNTYVVATGADGIYYYQKPAGGSWTSGEMIGLGCSLPAIAVDPQGIVYVAYFQNVHGDTLYRRRPLTGIWDPPVTVAVNKLSNIRQSHVAVAVGPDGVIHFVGFDHTWYFYYHRALLPDGTFTQPEFFLYVIDDQLHIGSPKIAVDSQNILHVLVNMGLGADHQNLYLYRKPDGVWSRQYIYYSDLKSADLALDTHGGVHIVGANGNNQIHYFYRASGWGAFKEYSLDVSDSSLLDISIDIDKSNTIYLTWAGDDALTFRQTARSPENNDMELSQSISLPPGSNKPTLAYMAALAPFDFWSQSGYSVDISTGQTTTRLYSSTKGVDWTHRWLDLTPWAGKSITLTYVLHQAAGEPYAQLSLDDISVGGWLTPLPQAMSPDRVEDITASPVISITGQNFIATPTVMLGGMTIPDVVWINEHTLLVTLNSVVEPGRYQVRVINPGGQEGILNQVLVVGETTYLPVIRR